MPTEMNISAMTERVFLSVILKLGINRARFANIVTQQVKTKRDAACSVSLLLMPEEGKNEPSKLVVRSRKLITSKIVAAKSKSFFINIPNRVLLMKVV
jgi:hypothetical protein